MRKNKRFQNSATVVLLGILVLIAPALLRSPFYLTVLVFAGLYVMCTIGLGLIFGFAGYVSLGVAAFYGIGAYTYSILTLRYGLDGLWATLAAFLAGAIVGYLVGMPTLRLKGYYFAIATLALAEGLNVLFGELEITGGVLGLIGIPAFSLGGLKILSLGRFLGHYYLIWVATLIVLLISLNVIDSRFGRALRALRESEELASSLGVDCAKYKLLLFGFSSAVTALAGALYASFTSFVSPASFTMTFTILILISLIIGGHTSVWGAALGGIIFAIVGEYLRSYQEFNFLIYGVILVLVMFFMPNGIFPWLRSASVWVGTRPMAWLRGRASPGH